MKNLVVLLLVSFGISHANDAQILSQLTAKTQNFSAQFKQKISDQAGAKKEDSLGQFFFEKPFKFNWHTKSPFEQQIVSDGTDLWTYDIDLEQVNVQTLNTAMSNTPVFLFTAGGEELNETFNVVKLESGNPDVFTFELTPKQQGMAFERMLVQFKKSVLSEILLFDTLGQKTVVEFVNAEINIQLQPEVFVFVAPSDVDVLDSRAN